MAIEKALLLIADIGGYTRFMKQHRFSLAHAQDTVAQLLEAVIDAAGRFKLAKLEGDAAFFYFVGEDFQALSRQIADIRRAFLSRREQLMVDRMCVCDGCLNVGQLRLKFVTHAGEIAFQKVKRHTELAGLDVILVHRMLKNDVPLPEYVLMTDTVLQRLEPQLHPLARGLEHEFEGIGRTATHYIALDALAAAQPEPVAPNLARKLWKKLTLELRALPYWLGLKEPCKDFHNVEIVDKPGPTDPTRL
jgi:class 3 adenylate cyclase